MKAFGQNLIKAIGPFLAMIFFVSLTFLGLSSFASPQCQPIRFNDFSPEAFIAKVRGQNITVEQALCLIPENVRRNFLAVYKSSSAQGATDEAPRIIMFDTMLKKSDVPPLRYAITFNGDPSAIGYQNIEIMTYQSGADDHKLFQFIDLDFQHRQTEGVVVSDPNPQKCLRCHSALGTSIPRPIWNAKGFFPGVYGVASSDRPENINGFDKFLANSKTHPRYSQLGRPKKISDLELQNGIFTSRIAKANYERIVRLLTRSRNYAQYKYAIAGALINCSATRDSDGEFVPSTFMHDFVPQSLWRFHSSTDFFAAQLANGIDDHSLTNAFKYYEKVFKNEDFENVSDVGVFGPGFLQNFYEPAIAPFVADIAVKPAGWNLTAGEGLAYLRWLMEGRGIGMQEFNMDVGFDGYYRFLNGDPSSIGDGPVDQQSSDLLFIANKLTESDSSLRFVGDALSLTEDQKSKVCIQLKKQSRGALARLTASDFATNQMESVDDKSFPLAFVRVCSKCHVFGNAPKMPFNDPLEFELWLNEDKAGRLGKIRTRLDRENGYVDPMPPTPLTKNLLEPLLRYLNLQK